ncbi:MAG: hypothetical protein AB1641_06945 [Thermodesulfobacteriota bacterium]
MILLSCALSNAAEPQPGPKPAYVHPQTGLSFPDQLGGAIFTRTQRFDDPGLGVVVEYQGLDPFADAGVYLYDMGLKGIGTGIETKQVKEQYEEAQADIEQFRAAGLYKSFRTIAEKEMRIKTRGGEIKAFRASFSYEVTGLAYFSELVLTGYKGVFLKVRFSYPQQEGERGARLFESFMSGLGGLMP